MPRTIQAALDMLVEENINLSPERVRKARDSRDWLLSRIKNFESNQQYLHFCEDFNLYFGSFARLTKIRPIDDIDIMIGLDGSKLYWCDTFNYRDCSIHLKHNVCEGLWKNCLDNNGFLNSTRLLNVFKSALTNIEHYKNSELHRMQQAVTLNLSSYEWNFDIIPCFYTTSGFYLIPNGKGGWMKTNPKKDQEFITSVNKKHYGKFLGLVRLIKYWNNKAFSRRSNLSSSYLLEVMLANYYNDRHCFENIEIEFNNSLNYLRNNIYNYVNDPKNIEGNINNLSYDEKTNFSSRLARDLFKIQCARVMGGEDAFKCWKEVLGNRFPNYGV